MELTENQSKKLKQEKAGQNTHRRGELIYINTAIGHKEVQPPNDDSHVYETIHADNKPSSEQNEAIHTDNKPSSELNEAIHTDNKPSSEQNYSETNKGVCVRAKRNVVPVSLAVLAILFTANLGLSILLFLSKKTDGVHGKWNTWGSWSQCSATCNTGIQTRNRACFSPELTDRGDYCDGDATEYRLCSMTTCSGVSGEWNIWGSWSQCSATCNTGLQTRNRSCSFPTLTNRGDYCDGDSKDYRMCSVTICSGVNGAWNIWGSWSQCSATCNTGLQARNRSCSFPTLTNRGDCCDGDSKEYRLCSVTTCSVNGGWSSWSSWTTCSASCMKTRTRTCTNPVPSQQGSMCQGNSEDKNNCDLKNCSMSALSIRLVNGTSSRNGRLEVSLDGTTWGTVCDDGFKTTSAKVVCWMLGYSGSSYFTSNNTGNGSIFLDDVTCSGYESTLLDCKHSGWSKHNCNHAEDIGVTCD